MTGSIDVRRSYPLDATLGSYALPDGWTLRTFDRPASVAETKAKGSILWLGGRGDIFEKYLECLSDWHGAGWHVSSFDWRGQGGSGRTLPDASIGHIDDFGIWIDDLANFWSDWTARTPGPHIVMGHSMGGHLVLRTLVEGRIRPDAAILIAPMLGFAGNTPYWLMARVVQGLGKRFPHRKAWKQNERPSPPDASRQAYLTYDNDRYGDEIWWKAQKPELALGPPSWGWMAASVASYAVINRPGAVEAINLPILIVATDGDQLVSPKAIRVAATRLSQGEILMFDKTAAHEVLREKDAVRDAAMARIATFLDERVLKA